MAQSFTDEIRETVSPYKFGGDRMAAALWLLSLDSMQDEETGDACDWHCWVARFGKRILYCDDRGFVSQTRFVSEDAARSEFAMWESDYEAAFSDDDVPAGFIPSDDVTLDCFQVGSVCRVEGYGGVAFRIDGLPVYHGSDYEWSGIVYQNPEQRTMHMVGDDRTFTFAVDDLASLDDGEFCAECGQIGCGWHD